jgi:hypothetical protein
MWKKGFDRRAFPIFDPQLHEKPTGRSNLGDDKLKPFLEESIVPNWKIWFPTTVFWIVFVYAWAQAFDSHVLSETAFGIFVASKTYPVFQHDLQLFITVPLDNQIAVITSIKLNCIPSQFERLTRNISWQLSGLLCLGVLQASVVIPTLNEGKYLSRCLVSLKQLNFDGDFEIIVVDGGSTDSTVDIAKDHADKTLIYRGKPVGDARNLGARLAEADIVAFIDADTIASKDWLSNIRESLSCREVVGVTGPTFPYEGSKLDQVAYEVATGWLQRFSMVFGLPHVAGFNCAYRREPFLRCGGFEEGRTLSEDLALSLKMRHEGRLLFNKNVVAYTSTRRVRKHGYVRLAMFYLMNDAIFALTGKSFYYPPVR